MTTCTTAGCDNSGPLLRGLCNAHYQKWLLANVAGPDGLAAHAEAKKRADTVRALIHRGADPRTVHQHVGIARHTLLNWCREHDPELHRQLLVRGTPNQKRRQCDAEDCTTPAQTGGLCTRHWNAANAIPRIGTLAPVELARGACIGHDPEAWFDPEQRGIAQSICQRCPVQKLCAEWGQRHATHGVWGGIHLDPKRRAAA